METGSSLPARTVAGWPHLADFGSECCLIQVWTRCQHPLLTRITCQVAPGSSAPWSSDRFSWRSQSGYWPKWAILQVEWASPTLCYYQAISLLLDLEFEKPGLWWQIDLWSWGAFLQLAGDKHMCILWHWTYWSSFWGNEWPCDASILR